MTSCKGTFTPCRHCRYRNAPHGLRGLCRGCFSDAATRALYPKLTAPKLVDGGPPCGHCGQPRKLAGRGLCHDCYGKLEVRARFPKRRTLPAVPRSGPCVHCRQAPISRPRGLCWGCYYTPVVKAMYQPVVDVESDTYSNRPLPPEPTSAPPGTPEKVEVLRRRAAEQFQLFHPQDA